MNRRYRKTIIAGNWKMNKTPSQAKSFIAELKTIASRAKWCEIILCVPSVALQAAAKAAKGTKVSIAAQNVHFAECGAFTGEVSCEMLSDVGAKYVILGHSERREQFLESDEIVNKKVHACLNADLRPIICVGESLQMREAEVTLEQVRLQVKSALLGVSSQQLRRITIAYEPIWAIGTGKTASTIQANEACEAIRECLRSIYGARAARAVSILYGGSMNETNAFDLMAMPDVDGGLIGSASLQCHTFTAIIDAANQ